jgi:hypothetical protein
MNPRQGPFGDLSAANAANEALMQENEELRKAVEGKKKEKRGEMMSRVGSFFKNSKPRWQKVKRPVIVALAVFAGLVVINVFGWLDFTTVSRRETDGVAVIYHHCGWFDRHTTEYVLAEDNTHYLRINLTPSGFSEAEITVQNGVVTHADIDGFPMTGCPNSYGTVRGRETCRVAQALLERWREEIDLDRWIEEASSLPMRR